MSALVAAAVQDVERRLVLDQTVSGVIEDGDPVVETETLRTRCTPECAPTVGRSYRIEPDEDGPYTIELRSDDFDAYLVLRDDNGELIAEDDDGLVGTNPRLALPRLAAGTSYLLDACAMHGERGSFELVLVRGLPPARSPAERVALDLEHGRRRVETLQADRSADRLALADALSRLGMTYHSSGDPAQATPLYEQAVAIREQALGPEHPDTLLALTNLGLALRNAGDMDAARSVHERVLEVRERVLGPDHGDTAHALLCLGMVLQYQGDLTAARSLLERAVRINERNLGPEHNRTTESTDSLAAVLQVQGDYAAALPLLERVLAIRERTLGPSHESTGLSVNNMGHALLRLGDYDAARSHFERALSIIEQVHGPEHPSTLTVLGNLAVVLDAQGDHAAAAPLLERNYELKRRVRGPEHPETLLALHNLAELRLRLGEDARARSLFEQALVLRERVHGPDHPVTADTVAHLGELHEIMGDDEGARRFGERALAIRERTLGPEHPNTAASLLLLARLDSVRGDYESARSLGERALAIREQALGAEHPLTAEALSWLGGLHLLQADYESARPLLERALAIREATLGPDHRETAKSLHMLAQLSQNLGDFAAARPLLERALAIRERSYGPEHPETASTVGALALLIAQQGDPAAARPLWERQLAILEQAYGPEHPSTAFCMIQLAQLLRLQGDAASARPLCERAVTIFEGVGAENPRTADALNLLASMMQDEGDYEAAKPLLERVLAIREGTVGPEHPKTATALANLGVALGQQGDLAAATALFERSLAIKERTLGPEHPDLITTLLNLGHARPAGATDEARRRCERALALCEQHLGPEHGDTASVLKLLAQIHTEEGDPRAAWAAIQRHWRIREARIGVMLASMSEGERYLYLAALLRGLELKLALARSLDDPDVRRDAYDTVLRWKGQIARGVIASREQQASRMGAEAGALIEELRRCQAQLSRLALQAEVPDRVAHDARLAALRTERGRLERELQRLPNATGVVEVAGFHDLRASLEPGSALVDLLVHRDYVVPKYGAPRFTAWVTRADHDTPIEIDLGPVAAIEAAVGTFLEDLVARRGVSLANDAHQDPGPPLRELLWDPIAPHLEGVETVFVSPDGVLGTLPFGTLPLDDGSLAIERFAFVYLQDATSLVRRGEPGVELDSLLAVGAVDFRKRTDWALDQAPSAELDLVAMADTDLRGSFSDYWGRLPATEYESQVVSDMHEDAFGDDGRRLLLQGGEPGEGRLKHELQHHAVLHLATHGFFQPEGVPSMWEAVKDGGTTEMRMSAEAKHLVGKHPGLLSGLVCAGANRGGSLDDEAGDDGYLTAEEVGWLDLSGVELVVLSACETGLGRAQSGEGLIGLRRAFQTAGARTVISSLWSVKDESTAELMRDFYKNLWLRGMGRHEALRAAQLAMLRRNRMEHGASLPSTWGAFVLSGEWR